MKKYLFVGLLAVGITPLFADTEFNYDSNEIVAPMWIKDVITECPCYTQVVTTTYRNITGTNAVYWVCDWDGVVLVSDSSAYDNFVSENEESYVKNISYDNGKWYLYTRESTFSTIEGEFDAQTIDFGVWDETNHTLKRGYDFSYVTNSVTVTNVYRTALRDRQGLIVTRQELEALEVATSKLIEIASSYQAGFEQGISDLSSATNNIPTHGFTMGLKFPLPLSGTRTALEGYVAKHEYDSTNNVDIIWLHLTKSLAGKQTWLIPYITDSGMTTNRCTATWINADYPGSAYSNVYSVVLGSYTYDNCHKLYVKRPDSLQDCVVWFDPFMKWGRVDTGISYTGIAHTAFEGESLYTGVLTDLVNSVSLTIVDGAIMSGWDYVVSTNEVLTSDWWSTPDGGMIYNGTKWEVSSSGYDYILEYVTDKFRLTQTDTNDGTVRYYYSGECLPTAEAITISGYGDITRMLDKTYELSETNGKQYLVIPSTVKVIDKSVFASYGNSIEYIRCEATTPPMMNYSDSFSTILKGKTLYVPYASISAYSSADNWSDFTDIQAIPGTELTE